MLHGRDPNRVARRAIELLTEQGRDFVALQELKDYRNELELLLDGTGHQLISWAAERGQADEGILVRAGVTETRARSVQLSREGWRNPDGAELPPLYMPTVLLDGWLRVGSVHMPPAVRWDHGRPESASNKPAEDSRRVTAYVDAARRMRRFARFHPVKPLTYLGDWNESPTTTGYASPWWITEQVGGAIVAPRVSTHGAVRSRPPIDYAIVRGCAAEVAWILRGYGGSDHSAVGYTYQGTS